MDLDNLSKNDLKGELAKRGEDVRGTKAVLRERLAQTLKEEAMNAEKPVEATTQAKSMNADGGHSPQSSRPPSSAGTSASMRSERAKEQAKVAGLLAKKEALEMKHRLEEKEAELRKLREKLEIQAQIDECEAKSKVFSQFEDPSTTGPVNARTSNTKDAEIKQQRKQDGSERQTKAPRMPEAGTSDIQLAKRVNLPELKLRTFQGNIESYRPFMRAFKTNIASKLDDEEEKLMYLVQFTEGKPKEIVSTCLHLSPESGYSEAVRLLERRYNNDAQTAEGLVDRLLSQANIKSDDVASLDSFAIQLRGTLNALQSLPHGTGVVDAKAIQKIIGKMRFMEDRWRRTVDHIEFDEGRRADFADLVELVEKEARIASNPAYGRQVTASSRAKEQGPGQTRVTGKTLAGKVSTTKPKQSVCLFCQQGHETDRCPKLEVETHQDKTDFIMKKGLCFSCLKRGHLASSCQQRSTCSKCEKRHPTALHRPPRDPEQSVSQASATTGHAAAKEGKWRKTAGSYSESSDQWKNNQDRSLLRLREHSFLHLPAAPERSWDGPRPSNRNDRVNHHK